MYHPQIIARKKRAIEARLGRELKELSIEQTRFYVDHLDSITARNPKGKPIGFTRQLLQDEKDFIETERYLCSINAVHWMARYHYIEHVITKAWVPLILNIAQQVMLMVIGQMELRGVPLAILSLKARQLGVSTLYQALHLHRALFLKNVSTIIASSDEEKTWKLIDIMMRPSLEKQPFWLIETDFIDYKSGDTFLFSKKQNSTVYVQHGRQKIGMGRGSTPTSWHFTELFEWSNPEAQLQEAFEHGVHYSKKTFGVVESTAKGRNNFLHRRWLFDEANYPRQLSLERPVFLPYFVGSDIYPPPGFLAGIPVPKSWSPPEYALSHKASCERYARTSPVLSEIMGDKWEMPIEQLWWYVVNYERAQKSENGIGPFLSEIPASPAEAFQSHNPSVFRSELLLELRANCDQPASAPIAISGSQIPDHIDPITEEIDTKPSTPLVVSGINHYYRGAKLNWKFTPLKFSNYEEELNPLDKLWIWECPKRDHRYVVALDDADGVEKDSTVIEVLRIGSPREAIVQVAEFASKQLSALDIWPIYLAILKLYSPVNVNGEQQIALASPEINRGGKGVVNELMKLGWNNFYMRQSAVNTKSKNILNRYGWQTNEQSRYIALDWFRKFVRGKQLKLNSPWIIDEMSDFVANEKIRTVRLEAGKGSYDDRILALAIALVAGHELEIQDPNTTNSYWATVAEKVKLDATIPDDSALLTGVYRIGTGPELMEQEQRMEEMEEMEALAELENAGYDPFVVY